VASFGLGWERHSPSTPRNPERSLTVLSYNRGQHLNQSLQPFKNRVHPDIIALQDAPNRARGYSQAPGYSEFSTFENEGEHTILSRYPVTDQSLITLKAGGREEKGAARFVIDCKGQPVALYSVHTLSPRDTLIWYRYGAFLYGVIGLPGTPWNEKRQTMQAFWDRRIDIARQLRERIQAETIPCIVAGDFNAPAGGHIHGLFTSILTDAHRAAGKGFGYTFPGVTRNPLSGGGPWMRIDYIFSSDDWKTHRCITESDRPSQHRALAATLELR